MKLDLSHELLPLLPPIYREVQDYQQICTAEKAEFDLLAGSVEGVQSNFFFQTMDEDSVAQWEKVFHIVAAPEKESLAFRRQRVMTRIATRPPYTLGFLYQKLDELIGAGEWTYSITYPLYELRLATSAKNQSYYDEVTHLINQIKPAHIVFISMPYLKTGILITEQVDVQKYDYQYRLGAWKKAVCRARRMDDRKGCCIADTDAGASSGRGPQGGRACHDGTAQPHSDREAAEKRHCICDAAGEF